MEQVPFVLACSKCSTVHPIDVQNAWGSYPPTIGLGPTVCCPSIITVRPDGAGEVCRGMLALVAGER